MFLQRNKTPGLSSCRGRPSRLTGPGFYGSKDSNFNSPRIFLCLKKYSIRNAYLQIDMMVVFSVRLAKIWDNVYRILSDSLCECVILVDVVSIHIFGTFESPKAVGEQKRFFKVRLVVLFGWRVNYSWLENQFPFHGGLKLAHIWPQQTDFKDCCFQKYHRTFTGWLLWQAACYTTPLPQQPKN